jgi:hypothetical protein
MKKKARKRELKIFLISLAVFVIAGVFVFYNYYCNSGNRICLVRDMYVVKDGQTVRQGYESSHTTSCDNTLRCVDTVEKDTTIGDQKILGCLNSNTGRVCDLKNNCGKDITAIVC